MKSLVPSRLKTLGWSIAFFGVLFSFSDLCAGSLAEAEPQLGQAGSYWRKVSVPHPGLINGVAISPSGQHIVFSGDFTAHSSDRGVTWETVNGCAFIMDFGNETHLGNSGWRRLNDTVVDIA